MGELGGTGTVLFQHGRAANLEIIQFFAALNSSRLGNIRSQKGRVAGFVAYKL